MCTTFEHHPAHNSVATLFKKWLSSFSRAREYVRFFTGHPPPTAASWAAVYACNYTLHCWPLRSGRILEPAAGGRGGVAWLHFHVVSSPHFGVVYLVSNWVSLCAEHANVNLVVLPTPRVRVESRARARAGASSSPSSSLEIHLAHAHAKQNVLQKGNTHATATSTSFFIVPLKVGGG